MTLERRASLLWECDQLKGGINYGRQLVTTNTAGCAHPPIHEHEYGGRGLLFALFTFLVLFNFDVNLLLSRPVMNALTFLMNSQLIVTVLVLNPFLPCS